jgi:hypothetical protein
MLYMMDGDGRKGGYLLLCDIKYYKYRKYSHLKVNLDRECVSWIEGIGHY